MNLSEIKVDSEETSVHTGGNKVVPRHDYDPIRGSILS